MAAETQPRGSLVSRALASVGRGGPRSHSPPAAEGARSPRFLPSLPRSSPRSTLGTRSRPRSGGAPPRPVWVPAARFSAIAWHSLTRRCHCRLRRSQGAGLCAPGPPDLSSRLRSGSSPHAWAGRTARWAGQPPPPALLWLTCPGRPRRALLGPSGVWTPVPAAWSVQLAAVRRAGNRAASSTRHPGSPQCPRAAKMSSAKPLHKSEALIQKSLRKWPPSYLKGSGATGMLFFRN